MPASDIGSESRRRFLKFLSGSPLLAYSGLGTLAADGPTAPPRLSDPILWAPLRTEDLIKSPAEAINVFDFEPVARKTVPPAHFGYMASGIDDEVTLRANREGFLKFQLRPRRLNDVSKVDMSCELFGSRWSTPIVIAPTGGNKFFHPEGELAVARALIKRAEGAGCPVLVVTVDRVAGRNQETLFRLRREDTRNCQDCHQPGIVARARRRPNYDGIDLSRMTSMESANMTWDFFKRVRDITRMKILVKGVLAHEDATLCVENGLDGLIVSNHGARGEDSGRSTIDALPEIVEAVRGRIPVLVDSGFRRGTDIVKGLALGASAVCVGRPYLWGLGAFGQPGVERVLELLRSELQAAMQQCGVRSLRELTPAFVRRTT